ncbi:MAG: rhodanese-like domain-containing protein [Verrucomicrobia bacterium]|nr:rhodanese-like domain-containing protein [Verrucomicrobiota bacterium]
MQPGQILTDVASRRGRTGPLLSHILLLIVVSAAGAAILNALRPDRILWVEDWSHYIEAKALKAGITLANLDQTHAIIEAGRHIVFDARPRSDYEEGHLPTALPLPYDDVDLAFMTAQAYITPQQPILAYCSGIACDESYELVLFLKNQGYTNVVLFVGGMKAWVDAGYATEEGL